MCSLTAMVLTRDVFPAFWRPTRESSISCLKNKLIYGKKVRRRKQLQQRPVSNDSKDRDIEHNFLLHWYNNYRRTEVWVSLRIQYKPYMDSLYHQSISMKFPIHKTLHLAQHFFIQKYLEKIKIRGVKRPVSMLRAVQNF